MSYVANYCKNFNGLDAMSESLSNYFKGYKDTPEIVVAKKELDALIKALEEKTAVYSEMICTRYNSEFTPVNKDIVVHYSSNRGSSSGTFDIVTGNAVFGSNENRKVVNVDTKKGEFSVVVGYSYPLGAAVVRRFRYSINGNNTKCTLVLKEEFLMSLVDNFTVKNISLLSDLDLSEEDIKDNGILPYTTYSSALDETNASEFICTFYGIPDTKNFPFSLSSMRKYIKNNKNFETIIKTADESILIKLLEFKVEKAGPLHTTIGCSKGDMDYALKLGVLSEFIDFKRAINNQSGAFATEIFKAKMQKTDNEWIDYLDKMKHYEEDFRFYGITFHVNSHTRMLDSLLLAYCGGAYPFYHSNMSEYYPFGKFCSYVIEGCINQGFTSLKNFLDTLNDYLSMCKDLNIKPTLYTDYLKQTHDITSRNHKIKLAAEQEAMFKERYKNFKKYERNDYVVTAPTCSHDVQAEGDALNHCVASYIKRVVDGSCLIYFLRHATTPDESLVTFEVRDNAIVQAKGAHNRHISNKEHLALSEYAVINKLKMRV